MPTKFYIEQFTPKHLKRANEKVGKYLQEIEQEKVSCQNKINGILEKPTFWQKLIQWLKV